MSYNLQNIINEFLNEVKTYNCKNNLKSKYKRMYHRFQNGHCEKCDEQINLMGPIRSI
ncbi:hypothetical protein RirG_113090 [Rhizophagus irregularis DAOM 197198w]|uniref:Uncharacterized protein n=1 Tax=Rhizophagus irregularis (strain DAOM 197198w) TaxID=1432141 RepID=A0A015JK83_RHIIW|nr:hypothetical protein RirG_113090 [Rhizophagus irregularis DAOM 197198w]